jgi:class 3 adenylate cyclase
MPNYSVKIGFGLHVGWAIEGAIGSEFKIDASYLSPNVNMSSRLEGMTKEYGSAILFTGALYDIMTEKTRSYCRHIDTVGVKGLVEPFSKLKTIMIRALYLRCGSNRTSNGEERQKRA